MSRKVTLVIHALNTGGSERAICALANHWAEQGREVTLITLDSAETDAFPLHSHVRRVGLGLMRESKSLPQALANNIRRLRRLRRAIREAGARQVISFTDRMNVLTLIACYGGPWDVIIAERSNPRRQWMGRVWEFLRRRVYPRCQAIVVQTESVACQAKSWVGSRPVVVIPNGVQQPAVLRSPETRDRRIVAMGRLSPEKGFDLLLEAFAQAAPSHPGWWLQILGEGGQRRELEGRIQSLQLGARVQLTGWTAEPEPILQQAAVFVLSSRYEGFPNALLEAMASGLACISFACDNGPAEIIRDGVDGLLVPAEDVTALAQALNTLMADEATRLRLAQEATTVVARFSPESCYERWDHVVESQ